MSFTHCSTCNRAFGEKEVIYDDGGTMSIVHGGGQCKACYLKSGHKECECGQVALDSMKFCHECGKRFA